MSSYLRFSISPLISTIFTEFISQKDGAKEGQLSQVLTGLESMQTAAMFLRGKQTQEEINARIQNLTAILHEHKPDIAIDAGE